MVKGLGRKAKQTGMIWLPTEGGCDLSLNLLKRLIKMPFQWER